MCSDITMNFKNLILCFRRFKTSHPTLTFFLTVTVNHFIFISYILYMCINKTVPFPIPFSVFGVGLKFLQTNEHTVCSVVSTMSAAFTSQNFFQVPNLVWMSGSPQPLGRQANTLANSLPFILFICMLGKYFLHLFQTFRCEQLFDLIVLIHRMTRLIVVIVLVVV